MFKPLCLSLLSSMILVAGVPSVLAQTAPANNPGAISKQNTLGSLLKSPDFSIFRSLLDTADLLAAMDNEEQLTIFAPDNAAFLELPTDILPRMRQNPKFLRYFLLYHMHQGELQLGGKEDPNRTASWIGPHLEISQRSGLTYVNQSRVTQGNLNANNGVLHILNRPLSPPLRDLSKWDPQSEQRP